MEVAEEEGMAPSSPLRISQSSLDLPGFVAGARFFVALGALALGACGGAPPSGSEGTPSMAQVTPDATPPGSGGGSAAAGISGAGGSSGTGGVQGAVTGASGGATPTAIAPADLCDALARAACEGAQRCCQAPAQPIATCITAQVSSCQKQLMPMISDARSGYNPAAAAHVIATFQSMASTCDPALVDWASPRTGLLGMFAGTVKSQGSCPPKDTSDGAAVVSCSGAEICHIAGVGQARLTGVCGLPRASAATCLIDTECDPAQQLRCDFQSPVAGNVASSSGEQSLGLHGHCVARLADGAKCARATECSSLVCENKLCVPRTVDRVYCVAG
jgi:hypothetical protein